MHKFIRKIVSTVLIAAMLFFVPSVVPSIKPASATISGCGVSLLWLPIDTAFAQSKIPNPPPPCPTAHAHVPAWPWLVIGCAASIVVSAVAANFWQNRQLTTPEAWTCGALYWWYPTAFPPQPTNKRR